MLLFVLVWFADIVVDCSRFVSDCAIIWDIDLPRYGVDVKGSAALS